MRSLCFFAPLLSFGDRFSASIILADKAPLFGGGGGIIFRPEFNRLLCAYGADGGTRSGQKEYDDGCDPGCSCPFCDEKRGEYDGWCDGAPHHPTNLDSMLRWWLVSGSGYNEVRTRSQASLASVARTIACDAARQLSPLTGFVPL